MDAFSHDDYKSLTRAWVKEQPSAGRGQFQKIARHLRVGSTLVSQIFRGDRHLTPDQALSLAAYFRFSKLERDYYVLLVQKDRAGTADFQEYADGKLRELRRKSSDLKSRLDVDRELTDAQKARFYSSWRYAGVRNFLALPGERTARAIASRLGIELDAAEEALEFLLESGLCVPSSEGPTPGPKLTHLEAASPLVISRQMQWRAKGFAAMERQNKQNLFYTCPMSLSAEGRDKVRALLVAMIQEALAIVRDAPSEELACLNVDWFDF